MIELTPPREKRDTITRKMVSNGCETGKIESGNSLARFEIGAPETRRHEKNICYGLYTNILHALPTLLESKQYISLIVCGVLLWGTSWFIFKDIVLPGGFVFQMAGLVTTGYIFGHILQKYTTIHQVVGMTFIGVIGRYYLGPLSYLDIPLANAVDYHLRRIYPVIILTKGSLSWNWEYIRNNSVKVFSLATLPWIVECLSVAVFAHILLEFPWYWGLHLGSILASVSPAVVVPTAMALNARGLGAKKQIAQLVSNAGGLDTAFTEGMFGVINAAIFVPSTPYHRIIKAILAIFVGIAFGVMWGILSDLFPDHNDRYSPAIRSLFLFSGGCFVTYACGYLGWGGTAGVAIMVSAGTAATRWSRRGWAINANPVSEVYTVLWRIFEPMLFALSGYFLEVPQLSLREFGVTIACIFLALLLRLITAMLTALANDLSVRESLFIAVAWIPKAIVEAVLVRVASDSLSQEFSTTQDKVIATQHSNIIVIAIITTTTLGSILTTILGPVLLSPDSRVAPEEIRVCQAQTHPTPQRTYSSRRSSVHR